MPRVFHHSTTVLSCAGDRFAAAAKAAAATTASTTSFCCLDKAEACGTAVRFLEDQAIFLGWGPTTRFVLQGSKPYLSWALEDLFLFFLENTHSKDLDTF